MTKNKKVAVLRNQKLLEFPLHVLEVKEIYQKQKHKHYPIIKMLTESEDLHVKATLGKMWRSLQAAENKKKEIPIKDYPGNAWVRFLVALVAEYSELPDYYYQTKSQRNKLLEEIKKHSRQLSQKLKKNGLDYRLSYSRRKRLDILEGLNFADNHMAGQDGLEKPQISVILDRLIETVEQNVKASKNLRADSHTVARQFVRQLGRHFKHYYNTPMNAVLVTMAQVIHGIDYDESDIRKILAT